MRNSNKILAILGLFLLSNCGIKEIEFDKSKWTERFDGIYEYRENMVADLMKNHLNNGMKYEKVIGLLGQPGNYHNKKPNEIIYEIMLYNGWNIDPIEGKELHIEFDKDSTIANVSLNHWKY